MQTNITKDEGTIECSRKEVRKSKKEERYKRNSFNKRQ